MEYGIQMPPTGRAANKYPFLCGRCSARHCCHYAALQDGVLTINCRLRAPPVGHRSCVEQRGHRYFGPQDCATRRGGSARPNDRAWAE
jgi:hypothetical protein